MRLCSFCCACGADDEQEQELQPVRANGNTSGDETSRPLLRMRWSKAGGGSSATTSPEEVKAVLLEGGLCFKFSGGRYTLSAEVGRGAHCVVWRCLRVSVTGEPRTFALKVHTEETSAFKRELAALAALKGARGGDGAELFPRLLGSARVHGRTGLALPLYGPDLYALQKQRERRPFESGFVWAVATQLLGALEALTRVGLVHADIKPQNVVLHQPDLGAREPGASTAIVLIDLGSCLTSEQLCAHRRRITYVQSRWYRAPEVLLHSPVAQSADAWSVGCVIAEVAFGVPLLPGESEYNQLRRIHILLGAPPAALLLRSHRADEFFDGGRHGTGPGGRGARLRAERTRDEPPLVRYLQQDSLEALVSTLCVGGAETHQLALLTLLSGLLRWDPLERWAGGRLLHRLCATLDAQGFAWSNPAEGIAADLSELPHR